MKIFGCLKNFGSFACPLVSSGVSIWTWHYVTSPKTVGEIYEKEGKTLLRETQFIRKFDIPEYKEKFKGSAKVWWNKCLIIHATSFKSSENDNLLFYINECVENVTSS